MAKRARCDGSSDARNQRGAALLEAAFVAPIFFALLLAAIEGGFVFYERAYRARHVTGRCPVGLGPGAEVLAD